jgi:hypothetical protein
MVTATTAEVLDTPTFWRECLVPTQQIQRRCTMNAWLLILLAILVFAPKSASNQSSRFDFRALALLLCVIAIVAQV